MSSARLLLLLLLVAGVPILVLAQDSVTVVITTEQGKIEVAVDTKRAPVTATNFLRYVDGGFYGGGRFHRALTPQNQPDGSVKIEIIQADINPERGKERYPGIKLERTNATGVKHEDGTISMARNSRNGPDNATGSFFICIGAQPELDYQGRRNPDGQGFAAFGRVTGGMDVVRAIQLSHSGADKTFTPVKIISVTRKTFASKPSKS